MRSDPGPGGTLFVELDGVGVTWMLRPTTEGPTVVHHGGDWAGQHSGFLMVPKRDFAITVLTSSEGGPALVAELFGDDWALREFAGGSNLSAVPRELPPSRLAATRAPTCPSRSVRMASRASSGSTWPPTTASWVASLDGEVALRLPFYRKDYVVVLDASGQPAHARANFVRGPDGQVEWLRYGGRLFRRHLL